MQPDLILGSDITYDEDQFMPLLQTIAAYATVDNDLQVRQHGSALCHFSQPPLVQQVTAVVCSIM